MGSLVFARGFAKLLAGLSDVENVVDDLEREADMVAEIGEGCEFARGTIGAHAAEARGAAEERGGFALVNVFEFRNGNFFTLAFEVGDLAGDELERARRVGDFKDDLRCGVAFERRSFGGNFKGLGEQPVAGKDGDALAKNFVVGEFAAAIIVIIHRGKVIVNQRVSMNAFDRTGGRERIVHFTATSFGGRDTQSGTQAFAAGKKGIAHRFVDGGGFDAFGGKGFIEGAIDGRGCAFQIRGDIKGLAVACARASCSS